LGWILKTSLNSSVKQLDLDDLVVQVPANWLVDKVGDDRVVIGNSADALSGSVVPLGDDLVANPNKVFSTWDPLAPNIRYTVSQAPFNANGRLADAAAVRNLQRSQVLSSYRILDQTPVSLKGRDGYRVSFAYVDASAMNQVPVVIRGADYYFPAGDSVLIASLETSGDYGDALPAFQDFAFSVRQGE